MYDVLYLNLLGSWAFFIAVIVFAKTKQYNKSVRPMYDEFIYPSMKYADLIIDNKKGYAQSIVLIKNEINKNLI